MKEDLLAFARRARTEAFLRKVPFLSCLDDAQMKSLAERVSERQFLKHQAILQEEDTSRYFYLILSGKVKVTQLAADGRERMLAVHKKGDSFGEMAMLDGRTVPATVTAIENTTALLIPRDVFHRHLLDNNRVLREIVALLCGRLRESWSLMKVIHYTDAEHRVRAVLQYMADRFGIPEPRGMRIHVRLTHGEIASLSALTRETVTRMISRLQKSGAIEMSRDRQILLKPVFYQEGDAPP